MIKKTLYFSNPAYLSLRNAQLVIKLPEVEKCSSLPEAMKRQSEITKPIEDIGVVILVINKSPLRPELLKHCLKIIVHLLLVTVKVCL